MIPAYASFDDTAVAIAGARAGAEVVRDLYGRRLIRFDKGAGDFATTADVEAEKAILVAIRAARPDDAVLGEEGGQQGAADAARQWLVDPLCGTLNHAVGTMLVAVNVALRERPAAVADPFSGEVFFTDGTNAWVGHEGADDVPLAPTPSTALVDVNLDPPYADATGFRTADLLAHPAFAGRFRPRVVSTTLALVWVAAGKRAAYVTGGDLTRSVHFAAGIAVCRAAGCTVTGIDGRPIGEVGRGLVVAADEETHALLLSMTRSRS